MIVIADKSTPYYSLFQNNKFLQFRVTADHSILFRLIFISQKRQ
jgi:hypothetical protein